MTVQLPQGFSSFVTNVGVKDESKDFTVVLGGPGTTSAGVFTKSRFAGPSVLLSRQHLNGANRAMVVLSKNANVATGDEGMQNAVEIAGSVAAKLGIAADEMLIASTGVIGRQYPDRKITRLNSSH